MNPIRCAYHPDREALQYCNRCGKPLCSGCVVRAASGNLCRPCAEGVRRPGRSGTAHAWLWAAAGVVLFLLWLLPRLLR